jgi:hypothetical protein
MIFSTTRFLIKNTTPSMFHDGRIPSWVQGIKTSITLFRLSGPTAPVALTSQPAVDYLASRHCSALSNLLGVPLDGPAHLWVETQTRLMPTLAGEDASMHINRPTT